ncbi:MAG TPA: EAL domain-containing protein, partial [Methylomirabilota bacterium]|nr:EAL domain-containing protein [Methylomirabilota bacterium]
MGQNDIRREVAFGGQRVRQKMILALTLSSVIPLLILTYCFYVYVWPLFEGSRPTGDAFAVPILLLFTALLMAGGAYVVYDLATALSRAASIVADAKPDAAPVVDRRDEIGTLMASFSKMMATIEQQAQEINQFPQKLDLLTRQAFHDPLTAMPNRGLFMDRLAHALARTERRPQHVAVLFLDIDRFKVINDSLGHHVGDQILQELARRLAECVRPEDTVARLGGDEFAILLEDLDDVEGATAVAERVGRGLETPFVVEGREIVATMSVGVALNTRRPIAPDELLRDADMAMYRAKSQGRNRYEVFDTDIDVAAPAIHRLDLELDLRSAVARDEFRLHYQPVVHLETGRVAEFEALVRWQHKDRGLLAPEAFISLTEETGLIIPIGQWVLTEACRQARVWQEQRPSDPPLTIGVNLSARQLQDPNLVALVSRVLTDSGLDPRSLKLEITESVVMQDAPATLTTLHTLRDLGIRLAIDDFGTGYSSLGYLKRFPIDTLKIDRSFVEGITSDPEDTAIVQAVISVAKSLGLSVTAEGIETEEQLLRLRELGCDRGQGFYFGEPLAAEIAFESLDRHPAVVTLPRVEASAEPEPRPALAALPVAVAAAVAPEPGAAPAVVVPAVVEAPEPIPA